MATKQKVHSFGVKVGQLVLLKGKHPHAGRVAKYVGFGKTIFGERPKVQFEDGSGCFVMDPKEWGPVK
jgi:hypothetical protein